MYLKGCCDSCDDTAVRSTLGDLSGVGVVNCALSQSGPGICSVTMSCPSGTNNYTGAPQVTLQGDYNSMVNALASWQMQNCRSNSYVAPAPTPPPPTTVYSPAPPTQTYSTPIVSTPVPPAPIPTNQVQLNSSYTDQAPADNTQVKTIVSYAPTGGALANSATSTTSDSGSSDSSGSGTDAGTVATDVSASAQSTPSSIPWGLIFALGAALIS